jgi:hypothetical protein
MSHTASLEEANAARLPLGFRDQCSACVLPGVLPPPPCPLTPAHPPACSSRSTSAASRRSTCRGSARTRGACVRSSGQAGGRIDGWPGAAIDVLARVAGEGGQRWACGGAWPCARARQAVRRKTQHALQTAASSMMALRSSSCGRACALSLRRGRCTDGDTASGMALKRAHCATPARGTSPCLKPC